MKMGYKIYSYDDLPREVKDRLSGHPDICREEWRIGFHRGQHYKTPSCGNVSQSGQGHPHTSNRNK
ncbi:MAG: hypothetical protein LM601_11190 [Candidatus Verstraetearchaeota archaeon]|nr:hypothetical protein [Candidatus Verstraetearchaeota archaeon]